MGADFVYAGPTAEIGYGRRGAVKILYRREIAAAKNPKARGEYVADNVKNSARLEAAKKPDHGCDRALKPAPPSRCLRIRSHKRETRPPKKHGTIPL